MNRSLSQSSMHQITSCHNQTTFQFSLRDNFVEFAKKVQEQTAQKRLLHLSSPNYNSNTMRNSYMKHSNFSRTNNQYKTPQNHKQYYQNDQIHNKSALQFEGDKVQFDLEKANLKTTFENIDVINETEGLIVKSMVYTLKRKVNHKYTEAMSKLKENYKLKKKQSKLLKNILIKYCLKYKIIHTMELINKLKRQELEENISLIENDLIVEKSKCIMLKIFPKINFKIEQWQKSQGLKSIIYFCKTKILIRRLFQIYELILKRQGFTKLIRKMPYQTQKSKDQFIVPILFLYLEKLFYKRRMGVLLEIKNFSQYKIQGLNSAYKIKTGKNCNKSKMKTQKYRQSDSYAFEKQIQRLVFSEPTYKYNYPLKLIQQKNNKNSQNLTCKSKKETKQQNIIEISFEEDENLFQERHPFFQEQSQQYLSTLAINEESNIRYSASKENKRNNASISNIQKNNNTDILDEEDQQLLQRLMSKYQRDYYQIQPLKQLYQSNNSNTTLNLNSHETLVSQIANNNGIQSVTHKKLNSMLYFNQQNYFSDKQTNQVNCMMNDDNQVQLRQPCKQQSEDKTLVLSPQSIQKFYHRRNQTSHIFNENKGDSFSVSKIEEEGDECQNQSRSDLQAFQNDDEQETIDKKRKDFSFSIEKEKLSFLQNDVDLSKISKKKVGSSRNFYNNQVSSKQRRERQAQNELNKVLNQQQYQQFNQKQQNMMSTGGGTLTNHLFEQETANFNKGDWKSPNKRPLTRSSLHDINSNKSKKQTPKQISVQKNSQQCTPEVINSGQNEVQTITKMNFANNEHYDSQSPILLQSNFANFSSEFLSPERQNKSNYLRTTTQRKKSQIQQFSTSQLLDISGATTLAQQSAFENFRQKLNDNMLNPNKSQNHMSKLIKPHSVQISPNKYCMRNQTLEEVLQPKYDHKEIKETNTSSKEHIENEEQLIRQENLRHKESQHLDLADPMEINSMYNSLCDPKFQQQLASLRESQMQKLLNKDDATQVQQIDEEEHDITLRKSPEDKSISLNKYDQDHMQNEEDQIINQKEQKENLKDNLKSLRESLNMKNDIQYFLLQSSQSIQSNHFQKRTLSHTDLVDHGTMNYQPSGYFTQRSQSNIHINDNYNNKVQNKFLDAFKQYEAEKVKVRHENNQLSQSISQQKQVQKLISQTQNQTFEEDSSENIIPDHHLINVNDEIQEREAEEEESFLIDNQRRLSKQAQDEKSQIILTSTADESNVRRQQQNSTYSSQRSNSRRKPIEVMIQLDVPSKSKKNEKEDKQRKPNIPKASVVSKSRKASDEAYRLLTNNLKKTRTFTNITNQNNLTQKSIKSSTNKSNSKSRQTLLK